jgi:hypothetical protein
MNELALFAGVGGGILGGHLLGWRTVCAVESEQYAVDVLVARQNDGSLPPFPIWDDVRTFDGRPWRDRVDVVSGGFPCQDISSSGKRAGIDGPIWRGSLATYDPGSSSWKTPQCSLVGVLGECSVTWSRSGTMRSGACSERTTSERITDAKGSGSWPTPTAASAVQGPGTSGRQGGSNLVTAVMWPTPVTADSSGSRAAGPLRADGTPSGRNPGTTLSDAVARFPTPTAMLAKVGNSPAEHERVYPNLAAVALGRERGHLNPTWVEWLMGWPLGWTDCAPLETDRFHEWQQQHSTCSGHEADGSCGVTGAL